MWSLLTINTAISTVCDSPFLLDMEENIWKWSILAWWEKKNDSRVMDRNALESLYISNTTLAPRRYRMTKEDKRSKKIFSNLMGPRGNIFRHEACHERILRHEMTEVMTAKTRPRSIPRAWWKLRRKSRSRDTFELYLLVHKRSMMGLSSSCRISIWHFTCFTRRMPVLRDKQKGRTASRCKSTVSWPGDPVNERHLVLEY